MKNQLDYTIIWKKINNLLSDNEKKELEIWSKKSNSRDRYVKNATTYHQNNSTKQFQQQDIKRALHKVRFRAYTLPKVWKGMKIASVFVGMAFLGIYLLNLKSYDTNMEITQTIKPGSTKATLVLSDGSSYDLENKNPLEISDKGATITKSGKQIIYDTNVNSKESILKKKTLSYNTIKIPRGGEYALTLSDGTKVWINSESILKYPVCFNSINRKVMLIGEAYFEVTHDKNRPFIVELNGQQVKVLGTTFNVNSYPDQTKNYITLCEGSVVVNNKKNKQNTHLLPGNQCVFNKTSHKTKVKNVSTKSVVSWKDGTYYFKNQSLEKMMYTLSRWYDFNVKYNDPSKRKIRFTGHLKRSENFKNILNIIEETCETKFTIYGKNVTVN